ncbi:MAG: DNA polymerase III subunit delta [Pelagibacterales bacterium]|nr:DNA polymerase III subunit delta [Pelagibacterales bacterium]PPR16628.1 MAG: hypothetical protein CFH33_00532 [Alphaproteobacteria bacterium MarineAlpha9_Bin3]|tara:strand:- start:39877 stop:40893 length:1017 start_codon:yes stop_codon:yes gene_type:complete
MKIKNYEIDNFCSSSNMNTPAILIYGEDYGLKNERVSLITKNYLNNSKNIIDLDVKSIISDPEILTTELKSISLLADKKVVRIRDANDKISSIIENNIFFNPKECLLILISESLSPRSKLRLIFEKHKEAVIIPCYSDDAKNIINIIDNIFKKENIKIDINAKKLLASYLGVDRLVTKSEIEKAILYSGKTKELSINDVSSFLIDQAAINIDKLYDLTLTGHIKQAYKVISKLQNEGIPAIQILRSFTRQLQNLYNIKQNILLKNDINFVIDNFKPPIYFKRKDNIRSQILKWSFSMIQDALKLLENAEINCKKARSSPNIITKHTIINISLLLKKAH